jgi:hypothetical protein
MAYERILIACPLDADLKRILGIIHAPRENPLALYPVKNAQGVNLANPGLRGV